MVFAVRLAFLRLLLNSLVFLAFGGGGGGGAMGNTYTTKIVHAVPACVLISHFLPLLTILYNVLRCFLGGLAPHFEPPPCSATPECLWYMLYHNTRLYILMTYGTHVPNLPTYIRVKWRLTYLLIETHACI